MLSLTFSPIAEAGPKGGGGGRGGAHAGGGGAARAGGGGAARAGGGGHPNAGKQINNSNRDVRTNNVRNTSVNNVNVNKNVNVNNNGGCCGGGWNDNYHPVATAAAVTAGVMGTAAVVGSIVNSVPANCVPVNYGNMVYQQCGNTWYQPQYVGTQVQYIVVAPPVY